MHSKKSQYCGRLFYFTPYNFGFIFSISLISAKILGCSYWIRSAMLGSAASNRPRQTEIIFEEFQLMWSQSTNVGDRRTGGIPGMLTRTRASRPRLGPRTPVLSLSTIIKATPCYFIIASCCCSLQGWPWACSRCLVDFRVHHFYRAMHFSAKRGIAITCRPSVCDVGELWSHRLEFFENNFTTS